MSYGIQQVALVKTIDKIPRPLLSTSLLAIVAIVSISHGCAPASEIRLSEKLGGETTRSLATSEAFTFVAGNANDETRALFALGNAVFTESWQPMGTSDTDADGLGPVFNRKSCSDCHVNNGRGQAPRNSVATVQSMLVRISVPNEASEHQRPKPVPSYGNQIQDRAIAGVAPEARIRVHWQESAGTFADGSSYALRRPRLELSEFGFGPMPGNTRFSARVANPLIGLGLLELIPDQTLLQIADPDDHDRDGISGRVNRVGSPDGADSTIGRFGWKASSASLLSQNAAATRDDIGITNVIFPDENCRTAQRECDAAVSHDGVEMSPELLELLTVYTRWLAVPRQRGAANPDVNRGFDLFVEMGCGSCHVPTLVTGEDPDAPELSAQIIHPFTDLLLHDMGEGLSDGRPDFLATGKEWRTAPLWGIGLTEKVSGHTEFLHDGRARSLEEAILWHGGEAQLSRDRYRSSNAQQRSLLLVFLNSL
jgi:CxxC motif-containing protein (DUF1111 family)